MELEAREGFQSSEEFCLLSNDEIPPKSRHSHLQRTSQTFSTLQKMCGKE